MHHNRSQLLGDLVFRSADDMLNRFLIRALFRRNVSGSHCRLPIQTVISSQRFTMERAELVQYIIDALIFFVYLPFLCFRLCQLHVWSSLLPDYLLGKNTHSTAVYRHYNRA